MLAVRVSVNNAAQQLQLYGAGALVRLERATAQAGPFTEIATKPLVAGTDFYVFGDSGGSSVSWYRVRVSNAGGTDTSDYSDPFQAGALAAYADLDDLIEMLPPSTGQRNLNLLTDVLIRASAFITTEGRRDFYRHPTTGTEARTFDIAASTRRVRIRAGLTAPTLVEYATATGGSFTALPANAWEIVESSPGSGFYDLLVLTVVSPIAAFLPGRGVLRVTDAFGFARPPEIVRAGTLALARLLYATEATPAGQPKAAALLEDSLPLETAAAIRWAKSLAGPAAAARGIRSVRMSTGVAR